MAKPRSPKAWLSHILPVISTEQPWQEQGSSMTPPGGAGLRLKWTDKAPIPGLFYIWYYSAWIIPPRGAQPWEICSPDLQAYDFPM